MSLINYSQEQNNIFCIHSLYAKYFSCLLEAKLFDVRLTIVQLFSICFENPAISLFLSPRFHVITSLEKQSLSPANDRPKRQQTTPEKRGKEKRLKNTT